MSTIIYSVRYDGGQRQITDKTRTAVQEHHTVLRPDYETKLFEKSALFGAPDWKATLLRWRPSG